MQLATLVKQNLCKHRLCYNLSQIHDKSYFVAAFLRTNLIDSWTHFLIQIDLSRTFRIFLHNPNGLYLSPYNYTLLQDVQHCQDYGATVVSLPELKSDLDLYTQRGCFHTTLHRTWCALSTNSKINGIIHRRPPPTQEVWQPSCATTGPPY
jgi:hypothetical protein